VIRKLLICPYFGDLPEWMPLWEANVAALKGEGYDVLRVHDLDWFKQRVREVLDIEAPIVAGEGKIHDYRCTFGLLFHPELIGYDFWGHTDFDCVYGRVNTFLPDFLLNELDLFSNHIDYVSGPWSLYRNNDTMGLLFQQHPHWRSFLEDPETSGWVEKEFTGLVDEAHDQQRIRRVYASYQTRNLDNFDAVRFDEQGRLVEGEREIMVAHFRRTKEYPKGCR